MNIRDTKIALAIAKELGFTLNLVGEHGLGKSSVVKQYAKENKMNYKEFRTGQAADAGDLTGLPEFEMVQEIDADGEDLVYKTTNFVLPAWFPRKKNTVVFFDEVNRGAKDILNGVFETILDLSMKGIPLPSGCQVVSAMNPPTEDYSGTIDFDDKAFTDRFVHIKFSPSDKEVMSYFRGKFPNSAFVEFFADQPKMMKGPTASWDIASFVTPSPRSAEIACKMEEMYDNGKIEDGIFNELLYGTLGTTASLAILNFKKTHVKSIKGADLIEKYNVKKVRESLLNAMAKGRTDMLGQALTEINEEFKTRKGLSDKEALNIIEIVRDLSKSAEHQQTLVTMIAHNQNCTNNCKGFETVDGGQGLAYSKELLEIRRPVFEARAKAQEEMEKAKAKKGKAKETEEVPF